MPEQGDRSFFNDFQVVDKGKVVDNADATLSVFEQVVTVKTDTSTSTITLPGVAEAIGKTFSILGTDGLTNNVTVADADDSIGWSDQTIAKANGSILLYSDGRIWHIIASDLS